MTPADPPDPQHAWLKDALVMIMTMREDDAGRWDPRAVAAFARSFSVDALGFSVGGITAFYPTAIPQHPRSPSLNGRDLVGEQIAALEAVGLRAIGRIDPSLAPRRLYDEHPDWFVHDATGRLVPVHGRYAACPNGGYYWEFMVGVVREILERYPLAGLWANAAQFSPWHTGQCLCPNCRRLFRAEFGADLPTENWELPLWRRYNEWRYRRMGEWNRHVHEVVRVVRPTCAWLPLSQVAESWDHARRGGWDADYTEPHEDAVVLEAQRRYTNVWWPGLEARYLHSLAPSKPAAVTVSYFLPWWRFYAVPMPENRIWTAQIVAGGAAPWLHVTGYFEQHFDRRGIEPFRALFRELSASRDARAGLRSRAEVALVYSRHSLDNYGRQDAEGRYLNHFRGCYNALLDARIPFDVLSDKRLAAEPLRRYRAVLLPNLACMADEVAAALDAYVEAGGHLVATHRSGFHDLWGEPREVNALGCLGGLRDTGLTRKGMLAAYGRIRQPDHPLFAGLGDTDLLPLAGELCVLALDVPGPAPLTFVPPVESEVGSGISVPEFNAIEHVTDYPLVVERRAGRGSVVYFPWQPDLVAYRHGLRDLFRLLANAVRLAPGWTDAVRVSGPGLLDVSLMGADDRLVLHLVNLSSPGSFNSGHRRTVEEVLPLADVPVTLRLPPGARPAAVRLTQAGREAPFSDEDGAIRFTVPRLAEFESVVVSLR